MAYVSHLKRVATALFRTQTSGALEPYHAVVAHLAEAESIQKHWDKYYEAVWSREREPFDAVRQACPRAAESCIDAQISANLFDAFLEADLNKPMLDRYLGLFLNPTETGWKAQRKQFGPPLIPSLRQLLRECIHFASHYTPSYRFESNEMITNVKIIMS